jgi:DNA-directed RNA polymerase subunit RPC12/RpoP
MPVTVECDFCGKDVEIAQWELNRYKHHFCGREHRALGMRNRVTVKCDFCGKEREVPPSQCEQYEHHFCNRKCKNEYFKSKILSVKCDWCEKEVKYSCAASQRKRLGKYEHQFCGNTCQKEYQKKYRKNSNITVKCDWCGKEKQIQPFEQREHKLHFCKRECFYAYKSDKGRKLIKCSWCGKEKRIVISLYRRGKHHFCSNFCSANFHKGPDPRRNYICIRCGKQFERSIRQPENPLCRRCTNYLNGAAQYLLGLRDYICKKCKKRFTRYGHSQGSGLCRACAIKVREKNKAILIKNQKEELARLKKQIEQLQIEVNTEREWRDYFEKRRFLEVKQT